MSAWLQAQSRRDDWWFRTIIPIIVSFAFALYRYPIGNSRFWPAVGISAITALVIWELNRIFIIRLRGYITWENRPVSHLIIQAIASVALACSLSLVSFRLAYKYLYMERLPRLDIWQMLILIALLTLAANALYEGLYFTRRWRINFLRSEVMRRDNLQSRFESLKHQVNPHFLFNSLNTLSTLIDEDPKLAVKFVDELSRVYRYVTESKDWKMVSLGKEMAFIETYMFLLEMRFGQAVTLDSQIANNQVNLLLPPLTLQLLVENAVKHNIVTKDKPLTIVLHANDGWVSVRNNLQKKSTPPQGTGTGIGNIKARYRYLTTSEVIVKEEKGMFEVCLPLLAPSEHGGIGILI